MGLFKSHTAKELDRIIERMQMNMANNYKGAAQDCLAEFQKTFEDGVASGKLKGKEKDYYESQLGTYQLRLKGYTHEDQKPYWH